MTNLVFDTVDYKDQCCQQAISAINNSSKDQYKCTTDCPFPCCLEELKAWEYELIINFQKIESIISWMNTGMSIDKVCSWHCVDVGDARRWYEKRKKIDYKIDIYKQFQPYVKFIKP